MAEVKNSFTSSKMNQDLDDRLVPSNEYREGRNISIISSDSNNTGAIENILGNIKISDLGSETFPDPEVIGHIYDATKNVLYLMLTNYTDTSPNQLDIPLSAVSDGYTNPLKARIARVDLNIASGTNFTYIVGGASGFLNFSTTHPITGINLIENLLFWTDNRNQPRKINVDRAYNDAYYYKTEDQISVAKYAPIDTIEFLDEYGNSSMKDIVSQYLPDGTTPNPYYDPNYVVDPAYIKGKFIRFSYRFRFDDGEYSILAPFSQIAFIPEQDGSFLAGDEDATYRSTIVSFMKNKVNQIGLMIPLPSTGETLTDLFKIKEIDILYKESDSVAIQILDTITAGSETSSGFMYKPNELAKVDATTSTNWTKAITTIGNLNYGGYTHNGVNTSPLISLSTGILINTTYQVNWTIYNNTGAGTVSISLGTAIVATSTSIGGKATVKPTSVVGGLSITPSSAFNGTIVMSIVPKNSYILNTNTFYSYLYQSRKPKSTLVPDQLIRVYDKVPVRALAQESSGGRIIYGNYIDKHTPPQTLDYNIRLSDKEVNTTTEYPLHTVKQNRNYQVGVVLSDRYGRQSDVILSNINDGSVSDLLSFNGSSTFYAPYRSSTNPADILAFKGNSIKILFNDYISSVSSPLNTLGIPATGQPGLYTIGKKLLAFSTPSGYGLTPGTYTHTPGVNLTTGATIGYFNCVIGAGGDVVSIAIEKAFEGVAEIGMLVTLYIVPPSNPYSSKKPNFTVTDITIPNTLGWYSYKIVVKQTQQEYYNVYLPGALNGYPTTTLYPFPTNETNKTSNIVLFSDNINKVPRDLSEVGPDQKQYRSSVRLFGRVQNNYTTTTSTASWTSGASFITLTTANSLIKVGDIVTGVGIAPGSLVTIIATTTITLSLPTTAIGAALTVTFSNENNVQFYPSSSATGFNISALGNASDLNMSPSNLNGLGQLNLYQLNTNPIIGRISTGSQALGVTTANMKPYLTVLETDPVISNIDIYWETSTTGLISELNALISQSNVGPAGFANVNYSQNEWQDPTGGGTNAGAANSKWVTGSFYTVDFVGLALEDTSVSAFKVINANNIDVTSSFSYSGPTLEDGIKKYRIFITNPAGFYYDSTINNNLFTFTLDIKDNVSNVTNALKISGSLNNIPPIISSYIINPVYSGIPNGFIIVSLANILGKNGSWSSTTNLLGLTWSFSDGTFSKVFSSGTSAFTLTINGSTGVLTKTNGDHPSTIESFDILLKDSGGMSTIANITLDFTPGDFDPTSFNTDFNI